MQNSQTHEKNEIQVTIELIKELGVGVIVIGTILLFAASYMAYTAIDAQAKAASLQQHTRR